MHTARLGAHACTCAPWADAADSVKAAAHQAYVQAADAAEGARSAASSAASGAADKLKGAAASVADKAEL